MPLGVIAEGLIGLLLELVRRIFVEFLLGVLIDGPGLMVLTALNGSKEGEAQRDGCLVTIAGIAFWAAVAGIAYGVHRLIATV